MREECIKAIIKDTKPKVDYKCALVSGASSQSGESVEITDIGGTSTITKAEVTLEHTYSKNGYDSVWEGGSGKNKLKTTATEETVNGLSFNPNDDGTINVSGTSSEALTVTSDSEIYSKRVVENGYRLFDEVVGGSVVWNQLTENGNFTSQSGWSASRCTVSIANNIATLTTSSSGAQFYRNNIEAKVNHVYLFTCEMKTSSTANAFWIRYLGTNMKGNITSANKQMVSAIIKASRDSTSTSIGIYSGVADATVELSNFQMHDLTQMFGSSIADYIYQLEQNSSGSGVAFFKKLFPLDYYAYNSGTIMSVSANAHELVGFNLFDKNGTINSGYLKDDGSVTQTSSWKHTDYISVIPNTSYYFDGIGGTNPSICWYDANKNYVYGEKNNGATSKIIAMPSNAFYVRVSFPTTSVDTLCINISNASMNGTYEPYRKTTYTLSPLTLRGIPKLVNNKLVYDGDIYKSSGSVQRRYGEVDLGTLTWTKYDVTQGTLFRGTLSGIKLVTYGNDLPNILCAKYPTVTQVARAENTISMPVNSASVDIINSSYTDAASFKTAMSGVKLIYELATPTTESALPYAKPQICEQGGTEEYVDNEVSQGNRDVSIPVGHNTFYADYIVSEEAKLTEGETYNVSSNLTVGYRDSSGMHTVTNSLTIPSGGSYEFSAYTGDGASIEPMIYQGTDSSYLPYENLGKFSEYGTAKLDVTANGETTSYMTLLDPANYGGSYDFVSGKETRTWKHIASYNGETLPSVWESDRDDYVAGTTPSVGAEVCYELATPEEEQYTAQEIELTSGATSTLSSPQGNITVVVNQPLVEE